MNQWVTQVFPSRVRIPHTRGDEPGEQVLIVAKSEYSPQAWGWTICMSEIVEPRNVFPTRVGMNQMNVDSDKVFKGIPHTRGDEPL